MNVDDNSPIDALCRKMREEIGLEVHQDELSLICSYMRKVKEDIKKPKEMNCELRYVYLYKVDKNQSNSILSHFKDRFEKEMVLKISSINFARGLLLLMAWRRSLQIGSAGVLLLISRKPI